MSDKPLRAPRAETFGELMARVREEYRESYAQFAERLGVKRQNVHEVETGKRHVSFARAAEWAERLGYNPVDFVRVVAQEQIAAQGLPYLVRVTSAA